MKVKYVGKSFGVDSLTGNKEYKCLGIEGSFLRIVDDSGEDYLYSATKPAPLDGSQSPGRWEVIEDDENGALAKAIGEESDQEARKLEEKKYYYGRN